MQFEAYTKDDRKLEVGKGLKFESAEKQVPSLSIERVEKPKAELYGWEKKWEEIDQSIRNALPFLDSSNPTVKALRQTGASVDPLGGGISGLSKPLGGLFGRSREVTAEGMILPFAKYTLPSERETFNQMDEDDKVKALAWESFGALLYALGPTLKMAKGPVKKLAAWNSQRKMLKIEPVEDALASIKSRKGFWNGFDYHKGVAKEAKDVLRLSKEESEVVAQVMTGADSVALRSLEYDRRLLGKEMSKGWKKYVLPAESGELYARPSLSAEAKVSLSYEKLQSKHFSNLYRENMKLVGEKPSLFYADNILKEQVRRFYGEEMAKKVALWEISETEMANFISSMLSPKGQKFVGSVHKLALGEYRLPWIRPLRDTFGTGEPVFQTKTKVFDKLAEAFANSNRYKMEKVGVLMKMLSDRGFGTLKQGVHAMEFVPNKELWTTKNLDAAYSLLKRIDFLAEAGRKGKVISKGDASAAIVKMMDEAKEGTPVVADLVSLVRDYSDVLYKDMLQIYLPKIVRRVGLTARGESVVSNLEGIWMPKIEEAFKTNSGINYPDRIKLVKDMLKDFRKTLTKGMERRKKVSGPGGEEGFAERRTSSWRLPTDRRFLNEEGLFLDNGKVLEKKLTELVGKLAYGSKKPGALPAYLEHYMPRIGRGGAFLEANWKQALVGEASFMKGRQKTTSSELVSTLQEMIEARTSSQAKQLFFYDEVGDVVKHAKKLPFAWREHTDFAISRLLGRPSAWDEKLATVLQKTAPGNWDAYRAMRVTQKITGLQYTGLIGLRPFSAMRNLTQPIVMTGAELGGGVRDSYSMLKGLALAGTKSHREYIRSIGAITEFVPDFQRGPLLPKTGFASSYDSMKDAFMWMFKKSDRLNRYWSGGAAVDKWDHVAAAVRGGPTNVSAFSRKLGLGGQQGWVKNEVENLLHLGRVDDAKAAYVRNIVANTQYLYTVLDAPAMTGVGGIQKTVTSFNSWWMNYGSALSRWATTGTGTERVKRMGTWLVSSLVAEQLLESWAGRETAMRSTFTGPLPLGTYGLPPSFVPMHEGLTAVGEALKWGVSGDPKSREKAVKAAWKTLKSTGTTFAPGGLMAKQMIRGYKKGEWSGLAQGIVQYHEGEFEPLFGRLED